METQARARRTPKSSGKETPEAPSLDLRKLLRALQAVRDGDFSVRLPSDQTGLAGKVADTFNEIVSSNERLARELERAGQIVGKDGRVLQYYNGNDWTVDEALAKVRAAA